MEREERIKALASKIYNDLLGSGDFTDTDTACAIAYLVGVVDSLSHRKHNTPSGYFCQVCHYLIGGVYNNIIKKED